MGIVEKGLVNGLGRAVKHLWGHSHLFLYSCFGEYYHLHLADSKEPLAFDCLVPHFAFSPVVCHFARQFGSRNLSGRLDLIELFALFGFYEPLCPTAAC